MKATSTAPWRGILAMGLMTACGHAPSATVAGATPAPVREEAGSTSPDAGIVPRDAGSDAVVEEDQRQVFLDARRECEGGKAQACAEVARAYGEGRGVAVSRGCYARFVERACDLGDLEACASVASVIKYENGLIPGDLTRAVALNQRACEGGVLDACDSLARAYESGSGVAKDPVRAAQLFKRVCEGASVAAQAGGMPSARACLPYAERLASGVGVPKDEGRAMEFFASACEQGAFDTCLEVAERLADGRGVAKDPPRAAELFETACANAFGLGCHEGAERLREGRGVPKDVQKAADLEDRGIAWAASGCRMHGDVASCNQVAFAYARKGVVPQDTGAAAARLDVACSMGVADACRFLAQKLRQGLWVARDDARASALDARARDLRDPTRARVMLERGCEAGVSTDCYLLGDAYLTGRSAWNVKKDPERGRDLVLRACADGDSLDVECRMAGDFSHREEQKALRGTAACDDVPNP
jgi:TPR repeat protein